MSDASAKAGDVTLRRVADLSDEAHELHDQISLLCAGHEVGPVLEAQTLSLAATLGFAASSKEEAALLSQQAARSMMGLIIANWAELQEAKQRNLPPTANA